MDLYYSISDIRTFFDLLARFDIKYVLAHNIGNELPDKLETEKDIDIIVKPSDYLRYQKMMLSHDYKRVEHPYGRKNGWDFLYNMHESSMFSSKCSGLLIDSYAELATKSVGMKAWIPLDKTVQESIWQDRVWNESERWWQLDDRNLLLHLVTRCIFEKETFNDKYIKEIEKLAYLLDDFKVHEKMEKVFWRFTEVLVEMLRKKEYGNIINAYVTFVDY